MAVAASKPTTLSPWGKAVAGAVAAMLANAIVYPLDHAKTRIQTQHRDPSATQYNSVLDVLRKIYRAGGLKKIYTGLSGTLVGTAGVNFAYFYFYTLVRGAALKRYKGVLTTPLELLLGAIAGALAQTFTMPISVITTRQQVAKDHPSLLTAAERVLAEDGLSGLWRGFKASLILVVNPSITYGTSSRLHSLLFNDKPQLSLGENFTLGMGSKAIATITTQPLIVAKALQQSSSHHPSFIHALEYLYHYDGIRGLFRGLIPQLSKGVLVQGLLLASKAKVELLLAYILAILSKRARLALPV